MAQDIKLHVCGVCSYVSVDPARLFPLLVRVGLPCISSFPHAGSLSWRIVHPYLDRVIHCTWVYPLDDFPPFFGYYFFNVMLTVLLGLHIYWAFLILKMFYKLLFSKVRVFFLCIFATKQLHQPIYFVLLFFQLHSQLDGDDRSDEEEDDTDSQMEQKPTSSHVNGSGLRGRANGHWHQQMTRTERRANGQSNWCFTFEIWAVKSWFQTASAVNTGFKGIVKDYDNCFLKGKIDSVCRVTLSLAK